MATSKSPVTVIVSPAAEDDLIEIWGSNVEIYKDVNHADNYLVFLRTEINKLATSYPDARALKGFPEFRFITMKKGRRGHGHYAILDLDEVEQVITVLRVYHTRMDLAGRLKMEFR
jgi:plasmid stabilization system protein ParE